MSTQAEGKFDAARQRVAKAPDDLAALREFAEAARGVGKRPEALEALKAAYQRRPTPELYQELRQICTYPEFQALAKPPDSGAAPPPQAGSGAELLPQKPFPLLLGNVLYYPIQDGTSIFILVCCSVMIGVASVLPRYAGLLGGGAGVILAGFPFAYFWTVVTSSGMGERHSRGWPDVSDPAELSEAFGRWFMVSVACFGPAILLLLWPSLHDEDPGMIHVLGSIGLGFLGIIYYPMALMLAGFTHDVWQIFNVPAAVRAIAKIPGDYLVCLIFFVISYVVVVVLEVILHVIASEAKPPVWITLAIISRVIDTYLVLVQMRTVGLLYYSREKDLGWFR